jgi:hypothetical protein
LSPLEDLFSSGFLEGQKDITVDGEPVSGRIKGVSYPFLRHSTCPTSVTHCLRLPVGRLRAIQSGLGYARYSIGRQLENAGAEGKRPERREGRRQRALRSFFVPSWLSGEVNSGQKKERGAPSVFRRLRNLGFELVPDFRNSCFECPGPVAGSCLSLLTYHLSPAARRKARGRKVIIQNVPFSSPLFFSQAETYSSEHLMSTNDGLRQRRTSHA